MLPRSSSSRRIYDLTRNELYLEAGNKPGALQYLYDTNVHARNIKKYLEGLFYPGYSQMNDPFKKHVLMLMVRAILAESFHTGFCGEFSVTTFFNALMIGLTHVEIIIFDGTTHSGRADDHWVIIRNRKKDSDLNDPTTWVPFTMIDTWLGEPPMEYKTPEQATLSNLCPYLKEVDSISSTGSYNKKFSSKDWALFIQPLQFLKASLPGFYWPNTSAYHEEIRMIQNKFDQYIKIVTDLSKKPEICEDVGCAEEKNIAESLPLKIVDEDSKAVVVFSIFAEKSVGSSDLDALQQIVGEDPKTKNQIIKKQIQSGEISYQMSGKWLRQVNADPQRISEFCRLLHFNEDSFRKKLNLKKGEQGETPSAVCVTLKT